MASPPAIIIRPTLEPPTVPLESGDHLTLAEFERRYQMHPDIKKAELIEGVVYVASAVHVPHSKIHLRLGWWVQSYLNSTPGVEAGDNLSVRLDAANEVQPDLCLWMAESGRTSPGPDKMLESVPDMVIEVAATSAGKDLHLKRDMYERVGVPEYVVFVVYEKRIVWHVLEEGRYEVARPDEGVYRSRVFPGLWLHADALWADDMSTVSKTLQTGLEHPSHTQFLRNS